MYFCHQPDKMADIWWNIFSNVFFRSVGTCLSLIIWCVLVCHLNVQHIPLNIQRVLSCIVCCGYIISCEFMWCSYQYSSGLFLWHFGICMCPFPIEVWGRISDFIPYFMMEVITYLYGNKSYSILVKGVLYHIMPEPSHVHNHLGVLLKL